MFFGKTATMRSFNKKEIRIEIDALCGFYSDLNNTANWKAIIEIIVA